MSSSPDVSNDYLYAPFRPKSVNIKDWNYKMNTWVKKIKDLLMSSNLVEISYSELKQKLIYKGRPPHGLKEIFSELVNDRVLIPKSQLASQHNSWLNWGANTFIKYPYTFISSYVNNGGSDDFEESYVFKENLEQLSQKIYSQLCSEQDCYKSYSQILKECASFSIKKSDLDLILNYLKQNQMIFYEGETLEMNTLVKIFSKLQDTEDPEISRNILKLKQAEKTLEADIDNISIQIKKLIEITKKHLVAKEISKAKSYLKRKIALERQLKQKEATLDNIEGLINQLSQISSNKMIYQAYKASMDAYKNIVNKSDLTEKKLNDTMDEMQELIDMQHDIENILAAPVSVTDQSLNDDTVLMDELEKELQELIVEQNSGENKAPNKISTPATPNLYPKLPQQPSTSTPTGPSGLSDAAYQELMDDISLENLLPDIPMDEPGAKKEERLKIAARK